MHGHAIAILPAFILVLFAGTIGILGMIFWVWMLIDCAMNEPSEGNDKVIWVIIIIFTHIIGAMLYFFVRRPARIRAAEEAPPNA